MAFTQPLKIKSNYESSSYHDYFQCTLSADFVLNDSNEFHLKNIKVIGKTIQRDGTEFDWTCSHADIQLDYDE